MSSGSTDLDQTELSTPSGLSWAFIGLGSNLGDSSVLLRRAMDQLQTLSDRPLLRSSLWCSAPVDCPPGSPPFLNAVVGLVPRNDATPEKLLFHLRQLEREYGRQSKKVLNEPRPLDLDLITFGSARRGDPELTLPHPRAHLRRFVLEPLAEIAPDLVLPGATGTVRQLLTALPSDGSVVRAPLPSRGG